MKQKKCKIIQILLILIFNYAFSNTKTTLFQEAINKYKNGDFINSLNDFLFIHNELIKNKTISAEVLYNIGNCYFKLNKLGFARYYYEVAKNIDYYNKNIKYNINLVKKLTGNRLEENLIEQFTDLLSLKDWLILFFVFNLLFFSSIIVSKFYISKLINWLKRISVFLFIITFILTAMKYQNDTKTTGIIIESTNLSSSPSESLQSKTIQINEAKKVIILAEKDDYYAVYLKQDKIQGWIKKDKIKIISYENSLGTLEN